MQLSISTLAYDLHGPIEPRLRAFRAAGFTTIDWTEQYATNRPVTESDAVDTLRMCERSGIRIATIHGATHLTLEHQGDRDSLDALWLELNKANIQFISKVGGDCIVLHLPSTSRGDIGDHIRTSKRLLDDLRPYAERCGVRVALENSPGTPGQGDYWIANREIIAALLESYPAEYLGWCFDSGHANVQGDMDMIDLHPQRLIATHLHDNNGLTDQHLLPGQGNADWDHIMSALQRSGYKGPLNLEVKKLAGQDKAQWCVEAYDSINRLWESFSGQGDGYQ